MECSCGGTPPERRLLACRRRLQPQLCDWSRLSHCLVYFHHRMAALDLFQGNRSSQGGFKICHFSKKGSTTQLHCISRIRLCLFRVAGWATSWEDGLSPKTGFVLNRQESFSSVHLLSSGLHLTLHLNWKSTSILHLVTHNYRQYFGHQRSLNSLSRDTYDKSFSHLLQAYTSPQLSRFISACDILTHAYIVVCTVLTTIYFVCLSVLAKINQRNGKTDPDS